MKFSKVKNVKSPSRGTSKSAGIDFYVPDDFGTMHVPAHGDALIASGIRAKVPEGFALIAFDKSGVASKRKLKVGACVVDEDYQGEIHLHVFNLGSSPAKIEGGDKLVQFILIPVTYGKVEQVDDDVLFQEVTERGAGGFGHTGNK